MSTSNKLTYLNETKQELKQAINNLGGSITDETTFRQYANQLQNVYDNLPKTEYQEGSNITLSNTLKGKLDFENGIVGFGQASQESTQGYQLINNPSFADVTNNNVKVHRNPDGSYTLTGTSTGLAVVKISQALELENGVAYYVSGGTSENIGIDIRDNNLNTYGTRSTSPTTTGSFTPTSDMSNMYVCIRVPSGTQTNVTIYPMISKTNTYNWEEYTGGQSAPNPSYPFPIQCVTGNQSIVVSGINIIGLDTNQYKVDLKAGDKITFKNEGTQALTLNLYTNYGDTTRNDFWSIGVNATRIITVAHDTKAIAWEVAPNGLAWGNYGDTLSTYEPYHTPITYPISLGSIELCKIGNYQDELLYDVDEDKVYKLGKVGKIVLDGSNVKFESKSGFNTNHVFFTSAISDILAPANNDTDANVLSNYFPHCKVNALVTNRIGIGCRSDSLLAVGFTLESQLDTKEKANTWLTTHNTEAYYIKATPTYTPITGDLATQLKAFWNGLSNNGTTILESNGDLPMIIKVRALKGE